MSINVTVAVPLETVVAIQEATELNGNIEAMAGVTSKTTKAVIEAVQALPYDIKPKSASTAVEQDPGGEINVTVQTLTGKSFSIKLHSKARASKLADKIQDREGIPPGQQCLIYKGKMLLRHIGEDDAVDLSLNEAGVIDGAVIHLVLTIRGS